MTLFFKILISVVFVLLLGVIILLKAKMYQLNYMLARVEHIESCIVVLEKEGDSDEGD